MNNYNPFHIIEKIIEVKLDEDVLVKVRIEPIGNSVVVTMSLPSFGGFLHPKLRLGINFAGKVLTKDWGWHVNSERIMVFIFSLESLDLSFEEAEKWVNDELNYLTCSFYGGQTCEYLTAI